MQSLLKLPLLFVAAFVLLGTFFVATAYSQADIDGLKDL